MSKITAYGQSRSFLDTFLIIFKVKNLSICFKNHYQTGKRLCRQLHHRVNNRNNRISYNSIRMLKRKSFTKLHLGEKHLKARFQRLIRGLILCFHAPRGMKIWKTEGRKHCGKPTSQALKLCFTTRYKLAELLLFNFRIKY